MCALTLSSFGCAVGQDGEEGLILRVAMQDDIKTLNPLGVGDIWTWNVLGYLYDNPINKNAEHEEPEPYIAVGSLSSYWILPIGWDDCTIGEFNYTPSIYWEDERKPEAIVYYDFTGVTWHDGTQMTIRDVLFSYHVAAQTPNWMSNVACLKDKCGRVGSNYPNDHDLSIDLVWESGNNLKAALKFTLQEPYFNFFRNTLGVYLLPYHIWGITKSGQASDNVKIWLDDNYAPDDPEAWNANAAIAFENSNPIGNGPFEFEVWDSAAGISKITTKREHFYKSGYQYNDKANQPNIDGITFKIYKTAEAAVLALQADDVDFIAWSAPPTFVGDLANEPGVTLQQSPEQGFRYLAFNMRRQSFGYDEDKEFPYTPEDDVGKIFRRAVAHCIDKNKIVQRLLLCFGVPGEGPISSVSSFYNASIPKYNFDPDEAIEILTNAGYQLTDPDSPPGPGNWWLNPDGSPIGFGPGGKIEILTPQADYDPIAAQPGLMFATEMQNIGIYAESVAMDVYSILYKIEERDFDMYIMDWRIGSCPPEFLHAFFHSSNAEYGQNYPGYQNQSFDALIDAARQTLNITEMKQAIFDAQAAITYDLPYDVISYRTNIEAYRSDNFVGWTVGRTGSIFNLQSLYNIRGVSPHKITARFVNPPSAMFSNLTVPLSVLATDHNQLPIEGAKVWLNASMGKIAQEEGYTTASGKMCTTFTAPYVPPTQDNLNIGTTVILNIKEATYTDPDGLEYDPAPSRLALITVYPVNCDFVSISMSAEPDVIDPDIDEEGQPGFTYIEVLVKRHGEFYPYGNPLEGVDVMLEADPAILIIEPSHTVTDETGMAIFTVTSTDLPDNDDSIHEILLIAHANHPDSAIKGSQQNLHIFIVDVVPPPSEPPKSYATETLAAIVIVSLAALTIYYFRRRSP